MIIRRTFTAIKLILATILLLAIAAPEWPEFGSQQYGLDRIVSQREFDFLVWEVDALLEKSRSAAAGSHRYLSPETRQEIVLQYLQLTRDSQIRDREISQAYIDPAILDPEATTAQQVAELEAIRLRQAELQPLAEAILEEQVADILAEEGLDMAGRAFPPVLMHVTQTPSVLIISPRDRIEREYQIALETGLTTPDKDGVESEIFDDLDLSALVVPIGGAGSYPSMITETSSIFRLAEVTAHEWTHHWLAFRPLGFNYAFDPDVRIINETVASIVDQELGLKVLERYYPEHVPQPAPEQPPAPDPDEPPAFDRNAELAKTRIRVEELLQEGKVEEAEAYMEERRLEFWENGHQIRKLNQAYFAFYGAYAADPGGAQGENPIGPMLREIRDRSPSIAAFLQTVSPITSLDQLVAVHQRLTAEGAIQS